MAPRKPPANYSDLLDMKYEWPQPGDRLIRLTNDQDHGVYFATDGLSRHAHIWSGYMDAGAILIDACATYPHDRHFLVYPIFFNYRHGLEVAMKWTIVNYGGTALNEIEHHNLLQLWKFCKEILQEYGHGEGEGVEVVEKVVHDFHQLDPDGTAFRYWRKKSGTPSKLPRELIDLRNLRRVMERIDHFLRRRRWYVE